MRRVCIALLGLAILASATTASAKENQDRWLGVHILMSTGDKTEQLTKAIKDLAQAGINTIVAEVNSVLVQRELDKST